MRRPAGVLRVPYLTRYALQRGRSLIFRDGSRLALAADEAALYRRLFVGQPPAGPVPGAAPWPASPALARLERRGLIRFFAYAGDQAVDVVLVDQGYGGIWVHTVDLWRLLARRQRALLIAPVEPLFEPGDTMPVGQLTRAGLRRRGLALSPFSFIHLVRVLLQAIDYRLLLITHRSQAAFLFDCCQRAPTIIYSDRFFDSRFALGRALQPLTGPRPNRRLLEEVLALLDDDAAGPDSPAASPATDLSLVLAGWRALADARGNWCWGAWDADQMRATYPDLSPRPRFVPPFIDLARLEPGPVNRPARVLFTTTMHNIERKGLPELLRAFQHLPREARLLCVVGQQGRLPADLTDLGPRVTVTTAAKGDLIGLYQQSAVYCRVSREDSTPLSLLEAMACELPVVVSPIVARQVPIIEDGATGFIVEPDDSDGLVAALRLLLAEPARRAAMGRECRRRVALYAGEPRLGTLLTLDKEIADADDGFALDPLGEGASIDACW